MACTGVILAGGAAARMGGEAKGLLRVGGRRIIDRVASALAEAADHVVVSANTPGAAAWLPNLARIEDRRPGYGALSGIQAALEATGGDILTLAWDAPFVPSALLRALREAGELNHADMAAPASRSPWGFEPLCAWFGAGALDAVCAALDAHDGRVGALASRARLITVDVSSWGDPDEVFFNVNTHADLDRAEVIAATRVPA